MQHHNIIRLLLVTLLTALLVTAPVPAHAGPVSYEPALQGAPSSEAEQAIMLESGIFARRDTPPRTPALLRKRVRDDVPKIRSILRALGYFKADISTNVDTDTSPAAVAVRIAAGPLFTVGTVILDGPDKSILPAPEGLGLPGGSPATSEAIRKGENRILALLARRGYPFARIDSREVVADHAEDVVHIRWSVGTGPKCMFGDLRITGLTTVEASLVESTLAWQKKGVFDSELVDKTRMDLLRSGLFGSVTVQHADSPLPDGTLPMRIDLTERAHRTIKAGLEYATDTGPGGSFSWEHRNLFGKGELLRTRARINEVEQGADARLVLPRFFGPWNLTTEGGLTREDTDAYTSRAVTAGATLDRNLTDRVRMGAGMRYRLNRVTDSDGDEKTFGLLSFPVFASVDHGTPLLDPTSGWRLSGEVAPYMDTVGQDITFFRSRIQGSAYLPLWSKKIVLALRGVYGSIGGTGLRNIPADERFYVGGGGSVRGYGYQKAGELEDDDTPIGGLSAVESSTELRARFTDTWGGVLFIDGGKTFEDSIPRDMTDLFWGAGAGIRYFTPIGPVRLDVGIPLERRDGDASFQVYVSIGQAF
jgi:translocation and assembly module TamA